MKIKLLSLILLFTLVGHANLLTAREKVDDTSSNFSTSKKPKLVEPKLQEVDTTKDLEQIKEKLKQSNDFQNANFSGLNLSEENFDLTGTDFSGAELTGTNLRGTLLDFSKFDDANLENANLSGTSLTGTTFKNTDLRNVNFEKARNLNMKNILEAKDIKGTILKDVKKKNTGDFEYHALQPLSPKEKEELKARGAIVD